MFAESNALLYLAGAPTNDAHRLSSLVIGGELVARGMPAELREEILREAYAAAEKLAAEVAKYMRRLGWTVESPSENATQQPQRDLEADVRRIISLIEDELTGSTREGSLEMTSELGEDLSDAIGRRTELAMTVLIDRLRELGLLVEEERTENTVIEATDRFRKIG